METTEALKALFTENRAFYVAQGFATLAAAITRKYEIAANTTTVGEAFDAIVLEGWIAQDEIDAINEEYWSKAL